MVILRDNFIHCCTCLIIHFKSNCAAEPEHLSVSCPQALHCPTIWRTLNFPIKFALQHLFLPSSGVPRKGFRFFLNYSHSSWVIFSGASIHNSSTLSLTTQVLLGQSDQPTAMQNANFRCRRDPHPPLSVSSSHSRKEKAKEGAQYQINIQSIPPLEQLSRRTIWCAY